MQEKAKVSVCLIVRDEPLLEQCLQSFRDYVDEIVVVDTGSKDNTPEIAKKYADIFEVYTECNDPETGKIENFSMARQRSFDLATNKAVMWVDSDDILVGSENLFKILEEAKKLQEEGKTEGKEICFLFPYEYAYNESGDVICRHYRERLITNKDNFHWVNWVHEVLISNTNAVLINRDDVLFKHKRQYGRKQVDPSRNLRILKKYIEVNGDSDARQLYYIGLEYHNNGLVNDAIKSLEKYISKSGWLDEKVMACLKLVEIYQGIGNYEEGLRWGFKAIESKHDWCEGYLAVAKMFYFIALKGGPQEMDNWKKCAYFAKQGLSLPPTQTVLFINPLERESEIHKYLNMALNKLGDIKGALESVIEGLKKEPKDPFFINNKKIYENFFARNDITKALCVMKENGAVDTSDIDYITSIINGQKSQIKNSSSDWNIPEKCDIDSNPIEINSDQLVSSIIMLWKQYMLHNDVDDAITFLENVPSIVKKNSIIEDALFITKAYNEKIDVSKTTKLDIVFFAGNGFEVWSPDTIKTKGIGGSELMMHEMSKRLAKLGHNVRVYNSCGPKDGWIFDGVQYMSAERYKNITCDVLIVSRRADALDDQFNIKSKLTLLWVHDVFAMNATNARLLKADKILALSEWHRNLLIQHHGVHPNHVLKTRNGIDLKRFDKNIKRNRFKCINSSSPDRSWPILLDVWPKIKEQVPEAELHLFYGFRNWELAAQEDPKQQDLISLLRKRISEMRSLGVIFHDRVGQEELAEEFLSSGVWVYPTWFSETSCLSAMEAQAAGCRMVTSSIAALNETAGDRAKLIQGDWTTPEYQEQFVKECVLALKNEDDSDRAKLQEYSKNFDFDNLAKDWCDMFLELIEKKKTNPFIPYQPTVAYR